MTIAEIRERRAAKTAEARAIVAKAGTENRQLSAEEAASFDKLKSEITDLDAAEQRAQFLADAERRRAGVTIAGNGGDNLADLEQRVSLVEAINCQIEGRAPS